MASDVSVQGISDSQLEHSVEHVPCPDGSVPPQTEHLAKQISTSYFTRTWDSAKNLMQHLPWNKLTGSLPWWWKVPSEKSSSVFHHKTAFSDETKYSHKWLERKWLFLFVESASQVGRKLGQMEKEKRQVFQELLAFQNTGSMKRSLLKELRVGAAHSLMQKKNSKW